ncbi:hypothetical protein [Rhizobium sp. S163]|uniref:hypothetical protein n=1 Tax=Rhizobium sp. S163 TaxID=3055039 RepID=UPI0025A93D61|nr:hypothetical protein [Rhizobium sp. S163]MDM9647425.1 hypothetical protein [Rhizobium sp. S163]
MSALLSRLKDFGEPAVAAPPVVDTPFSEDFGGFDDIVSEPVIDIEAERRDANAIGEAKATAELTEKFEAEAQTVALVHQREIEELRNKYETEIAELVAAKVKAISTELADLVSATVARTLAPVLTEALAEKAAVELAAQLRDAVLDGETGTITVKGPERLFNILKNELGEKADLLRHHENDDIDLIAEFDDSVLVTRMSAWAASVKKVLE